MRRMQCAWSAQCPPPYHHHHQPAKPQAVCVEVGACLTLQRPACLQRGGFAIAMWDGKAGLGVGCIQMDSRLLRRRHAQPFESASNDSFRQPASFLPPYASLHSMRMLAPSLKLLGLLDSALKPYRACYHCACCIVGNAHVCLCRCR